MEEEISAQKLKHKRESPFKSFKTRSHCTYIIFNKLCALLMFSD